jgi:hypothetical protein
MALQTFVNTHVKFGSFVLPNVLLRPTQRQDVRLRTAPIPNRPGVYTAGGVPDAHHVHIVGKIVLSPGQSMDDAWRELTTGIPRGIIDKLYTRQDDTTFRWAERESLDPGDSQEGSALDYSVSFLCADPYEYRDTLDSGLRTGVGALVVNNIAGSLPTPPTIEVIVASVVGANPLVTITNATTGKALTISPGAAATYTLNHRLRTVTRSTGGDARPDLGAASVLFDLALGNNTINIAASNCTLGDTTVSWRSRWE